MYELILILHILVCATLVIVILIQAGKGAGLGIMGGGTSENLFSAPSGSLFLRKLTAGLAIAFICTTLLLTILQGRKTTRSVMERVASQQAQ